MTIYIILIIYIIMLKIFAVYCFSKRETQEKFILNFGIGALFLLLALKNVTVGVDILGYQQQYELSRLVSWSDWEYVYFEPGYTALMKMFSKIGLSFRNFLVLIYGVSCNALYLFIKRYSKNTTFSLIIFICYQFFVFYISGIRQTLAMSLCIYSYLIWDSIKFTKMCRVCMSVGIVLIASTIHQSALLFLLVLIIAQLKTVKEGLLCCFLGGVTVIVFKKYILSIMGYFLGSVKQSGNADLGGNFYFLILLAVFGVLGVMQKTRKGLSGTEHINDNTSAQKRDFFVVTTNVLLFSVVIQMMFAGTNLFRASMYLTLFLIPGLTHIVKKYESRTEFLATIVLGCLFIYLFINDTLIPNQLQLCPYVFWQS